MANKNSGSRSGGGQSSDDLGHNLLSSLKKILSSPDLKRLLPMIVFTSLIFNFWGLAVLLYILQIFDRVLKNQSTETLIVIVFVVVLILIL